jgi:hypothetical protein
MFLFLRRQALLLILASGMLALPCLAEQDAVSVEGLFKTPANITLVKKSAQVDACILTLPKPSTPESKESMLRGDAKYVEGEYVEVPAKLCERLRESLLNNHTYKWGVATSCVPLYQARVRFREGDHVLTVDFCFRCKILQLSLNNKFIGNGLFGWDEANASDFLDVMRELFPKEPAFMRARR